IPESGGRSRLHATRLWCFPVGRPYRWLRLRIFDRVIRAGWPTRASDPPGRQPARSRGCVAEASLPAPEAPDLHQSAGPAVWFPWVMYLPSILESGVREEKEKVFLRTAVYARPP